MKMLIYGLSIVLLFTAAGCHTSEAHWSSSQNNARWNDLKSDVIWSNNPARATNLLTQLLVKDPELGFSILLPRMDGWSQGPDSPTRLEPFTSGGRRGEPYSVAELVMNFSPGEGERLIDFMTRHSFNLNGPQRSNLTISLHHAFALSRDALRRSVVKAIMKSTDKNTAILNLRSTIPSVVDSLERGPRQGGQRPLE